MTQTQWGTYRFAPLHLEGEICWHDLILLPCHMVGEAMQGGILMEGSFGWVVVGVSKALLHTEWLASAQKCVVYRTRGLIWTHLGSTEYTPHTLKHKIFREKKDKKKKENNFFFTLMNENKASAERLSSAVHVRTCWFCPKLLSWTKFEKFKSEH